VLDYKFRSVNRTDTETIVDAVFYQGDYQMVRNPDTGLTEQVYVRSGRVAQRRLVFDGTVNDDDLCRVLNERLAQRAVAVRTTPIPQQVVITPSRVQPKSET